MNNISHAMHLLNSDYGSSEFVVTPSSDGTHFTAVVRCVPQGLEVREIGPTLEIAIELLNDECIRFIETEFSGLE